MKVTPFTLACLFFAPTPFYGVEQEIIVLRDGVIKERGRHDALLAQGGLYASMWTRQREATEAEEQLKRMREADEFGIFDRRRLADPDNA